MLYLGNYDYCNWYDGDEYDPREDEEFFEEDEEGYLDEDVIFHA